MRIGIIQLDVSLAIRNGELKQSAPKSPVRRINGERKIAAKLSTFALSKLSKWLGVYLKI
jgi:hypothetical protein